MLTCPVCHQPLALDGRTWRCAAGHAFDRAREGYVDLLPVGHGRSGITGDTRAMARARARFLRRGHYDALVARIVARVLSHVGDARPPAAHPSGHGPAVAEAGCGTGHYIGALAGSDPALTAFGFDVSRDALRVAARSHPGVTFAVNDVAHRLCLADASVDALLDVFAPRNPAEFRRVLRPGGLLLVVVPEEGHLAELRGRYPLLEIEPEKRARTLERLGPSFALAWEEAVERALELDPDDVADLLAMTPGAFHRDDPAARAPGPERITARFRLLGLRAV